MAFQDYNANPSVNLTLSDGTYIGPSMLRNKVRPALQTLAADGKELSDEVTALQAYVESGFEGIDTGSVADLTLRPDLAASSGAGLLGWISAGVGAVVRTIRDRLRDNISVKDFGAKGDSNAAGSIGTDDRAAIQAALDHLNTIGGGTLFFPAGFYKVSGYLTVYPNTMIVGAGRRAAVLVSAHAGGGGSNAHENLRNGSIFCTIAPINSSTAINVSIRDIGLYNSNAANVGAGLYDRCGTFLTYHNVRVIGFKFGMVWDQTELADTDLCEFSGQVNSGAAVWLVNGPDLTPTASSGFTNRLSINRCQINQSSTIMGIVDDGGYSHTFQDNNINGCINHFRLAGVEGQIIGGEYESSASHIAVLTSFTWSGAGAGGPTLTVMGGLYAAVNGFGCFSIASAGHISFTGGLYATPSGASIRGAANAFALVLNSVSVTFAADPIVDGYSTVGGEIQRFSSAAPTTGLWRQGQMFFNTAPATAGAPLGWRCTVAGSPGTWVPFYGVGAAGAAVTAPTGGATVDAEARTAINALISRLQAHGLIS